MGLFGKQTDRADSDVEPDSGPSLDDQRDPAGAEPIYRRIFQASPDASSAEPPVSGKERTRTRGGRVLLVEDNAVNRKLALKMLDKLGYEADAACNGREAVGILTHRPYAAVLMDVQMPEMDGLEATAAIRDPATGVLDPRVPIIAVTAHAMRGDRERCLDSGMDDYIPKPVDPAVLGDVLGRWTGRDEQAEESPEVAATETSSAKVFDRADLFARLGDDEQLLSEIVALFLEDAPKQMAAIEQAMTAGDAEEVRRHAHSLKGASANMAAVVLSEAAHDLEGAARSGNMTNAGGLLPTVRSRFEELRAVLEENAPQ